MDTRVLLSTFLVLFFVSTAQSSDKSTATPTTENQAWNTTWVDKLKRHILMNYDKFARPAQHTVNTTITLGYTITHVDLDEKKNIMELHGWTKMRWVDEKLKWNSSEFGKLNIVHVGDHEVWQPDIVLYNSASGSNIDHYGNTHCLVYDTGDVLWVPPTQFFSFCNLDLRLWPYDTQTCKVVLGSWTYSGEEIDILISKEGVDIEKMMLENTEWKIVNTSVERFAKYYDCCAEPYVSINIDVTLKRRSGTYSALLFTPATVIVLMTLTVFWLPPDSGEKIWLGGTTAIIITLFLLFFSKNVKAMASQTPLIVLFYSNSLYLVCLSIIVSVVVINLSRNKHSAPLSWFFKSLLRGPFGKILFLGSNTSKASQHDMISHNNEEMREGHGEEHVTVDDRQMISQTHSSTQNDWILMAMAIDRITFLVYCFMFAILSISYSV